MKKDMIIGIACIIVVGVAICIAGLNIEMNVPGDDYPVDTQMQTLSGPGINIFSFLIGDITIDTDLPESPPDIRIYRGYFQEGDLVEYYPGTLRRIQNPIPEDEAPAVAEQILSDYGGLPSDAILLDNFIMYAEKYNRTNHELTERFPEGNFVSWCREIDGMELRGDSDIIQIDMGENGEVIRVYKCWRTYESLGNVSIISAAQAIEKLRAGEVIDPVSGGIRNDVSIYKAHLSYYIDGLEEPEVILEPIWVFYGDASGIYIPFYVYAREFADFTATSTYGTAPLTVTFTDTSDASPINWNWDLGDGKTSEEQNPVHIYTTAGAYTVTLKATNYLGSDTMTKTSYILIGKMAIVMHIGSKLDELIAVVNAMQFDNGIKKSLIQKLDNAKAKNDDALKFISQNKEEQANNMLNAEDNLMQAFINEVDAQTGKGITTDDAAKLTSMVVEIQGLIQEAIETPI